MRKRISTDSWILLLILFVANNTQAQIKEMDEVIFTETALVPVRDTSVWVPAGTRMTVRETSETQVAGYIPDGFVWVSRGNIAEEQTARRLLKQRMESTKSAANAVAYSRTIEDVSEGLDLTSDMLQRYRGNAEVWVQRATFLHTSNQIAEAISAYQKAIRLGDSQPSTRLSLADALFVAGERDDAINVLNPLLEDESAPLYAVSAIKAASFLELMGSSGDLILEWAREAEQRIDQLDFPKRVETLRLLAEGFGRNGDSRSQESWYLKAIAASEKYEAHSSLLLMKVGEFYQTQVHRETSSEQREVLLGKARDYFGQLVEHFPNFVNGHYVLSVVDFDLGNREAALASALRSRRLLEEFEEQRLSYTDYYPCCGAMPYHQIYVNVAKILTDQRQLSQGIYALRRAANYKDEDNGYVPYLLADAELCRRNVKANELPKLLKSLVLGEDSPLGATIAAQEAALLGRFQKAIGLQSKAIEGFERIVQDNDMSDAVVQLMRERKAAYENGQKGVTPVVSVFP